MKKAGKLIMALGCLLVIAAVVLVVNNIREDSHAGIAATETVRELREAIETTGFKNVAIDTSFGEPIMAVPDYQLSPNMDMPKMELNGNKYIAALEIPAIGVDLPVLTDWSYEGLRESACRYSGSAYQNDLIIIAHNYSQHFRYLNRLSKNDTIVLTDIDGNEFHYSVTAVEEIDAYAIDDLHFGEWDLSLVTCTVGGASRVVVRCELTEVL